MDQAFFRVQAANMARTQVQYLLKDSNRLNAETSLSQAVGIIRDSVRHLCEPGLAIRLALAFHPMVERWAAWAFWATALDLVLPFARDADYIQLLLCRSQAARELGDYEVARAFATEARQLAEMRDDVELLAKALNRLGMIAWRRDDLVTARAYWEQAYQLGEEQLDPMELGHISLNLGVVAVHQARLTEAEQIFTQALGHYQAASDTISVAKVQCNLADLYRRQGKLRLASATILPGLETLRAAGAHYDYGLAENDLGCIYLSLNYYDRALQALQTSIESLDRIGSINGKAWVLPNLVELYVTTEQWDKAQVALREARALATLCRKPLIEAAIDVDEGRMLAARGHPEQAREVWERALTMQIALDYQIGVRQTRVLLETLSSKNE